MQEVFNYVMITRCGGIGDLMMLEPTLEALYYKHAPCRIIFRTHKLYDWVLKDHPLIWKHLYDDYSCNTYAAQATGTFLTTLRGCFDTPVMLHNYNFQDVLEHYSKMHGVDTFAAIADVKLLRRTPSFGHYDFTMNNKTVIQLRKNTDRANSHFRDLTTDSLPMELLSDAYFLPEDQALDPQEFKDLVTGCDLFIGSDSCGIHMAHAAGVRKIIGIYNDKWPASTRAYPGVISVRTVKELQREVEIAQKEEKYPRYLNIGNAVEFIKNKALESCKGDGLDVGSNHWPLPGCLAISDENQRQNFELAPFDFIFSSHCLEHIAEWQEELTLWDKSIRVGGKCFIYLPHPSMEMWKPNTGSWQIGHLWAPSPVTLVKWINENTNLRVEEYSCHPDPHWGFYILARKVS